MTETDIEWPKLEKGHQGYKQGEYIVLTGGRAGKGRLLVEQLAAKLIAEGHRVNVGTYEEPPEPIHIPESLDLPDVSAHPTGKKPKLKKRRLKRKPGGKL